jgi:hypothetical protein
MYIVSPAAANAVMSSGYDSNNQMLQGIIDEIIAPAKQELGLSDADKSDIERKLSAVGVDVAWVNDSEYHRGGGNVHCGTNSKQTPVCADFTDCL